jgi:hypothetical protein
VRLLTTKVCINLKLKKTPSVVMFFQLLREVLGKFNNLGVLYFKMG